MAIAAGVPPPRAYVIPDNDPNAFATGRDPELALIAVVWWSQGRRLPAPRAAKHAQA